MQNITNMLWRFENLIYGSVYTLQYLYKYISLSDIASAGGFSKVKRQKHILRTSMIMVVCYLSNKHKIKCPEKVLKDLEIPCSRFIFVDRHIEYPWRPRTS